MKRQTNRAPARIPEQKTMVLPPKGYQPSKAEMEEEIDMPSMSDKQVRETFFRPFRFVKRPK